MAADVKINFRAESAGAKRDISLLKKEITDLRGQLGQTQHVATESAAAVDALGTEAREATIGITALGKNISTTTAEAKELTERILIAEQAVDALTPTLQQAALAVAGSSGLTPFMRSAAVALAGFSSELEGVDEPIKQFQISLADTTEETRAFNLIWSEISHELTAFAAEQAIATAEIKLVNPAISDAAGSMQLYIREMDQLQDRLEETDTISERMTASIRDQASAFDALRSSVNGVSQAASGLQGQQLGSGIFDRFDARTPGSSFSSDFSENLKQQSLRLGTELLSQGIRTAGGLKRIEEDRVRDLEELEREYSETILAINEEKARKLGEIEERIETERHARIAAIKEAFADAAAAEVDARQDAADKILEIEARAEDRRAQLREQITERLIDLEQRREDRIAGLTDGFTERESERQQKILEIVETAAEQRLAAEERYAEQMQAINNKLVEDVLAVRERLTERVQALEDGFVARETARAERIVELTQDAAEKRLQANETYAETMQGIYNAMVAAWDALEDGFLEREDRRATERVEIEQKAADARVAANQTYSDRVAQISTDLVDEVRRLEAEIIDVQERHAQDRFAIEQESLENRADANTEYARRVAEIETDRDRHIEDTQRRLAEIQEAAADARLAADTRYASVFQGIQNDLVDEVVDIQRDLNDRLNDLRDAALDVERDRQQSLVDLHEETQQKLKDLERDAGRTEEDLQTEFRRDQEDAATRLARDRQDAAGDPEREAAAQQRHQRRIADLTRAYQRDVLDARKRQERRREDLLRAAAAKEIEIATRKQQQLVAIEQQTVAAKAKADSEITTAETQAGTTFAAAQANYVPALSAHEQTLLAHAEALNRIDAGTATATEAAEQSLREALRAGVDETAAAGQTLRETLSAVTAAEQERLGALHAETTATVGTLQTQIADAEDRTGLSFEAALENYTPAVDLNTQALQALTDALNQAATEREVALGAVDAAGVTDRATTTAAQQALGAQAGVSIDEARANYVPAVNAATQATLTLNQTLQALETAFQAETAKIYEAGLVDRATVDAAVQEAIQIARENVAALETQAGTTFAAASAAFRPGLSDRAQAGADRDTALSNINQTETESIDAVNAQGIADRLETDAAITEARDTYIKARDEAIYQHNTAMLELNQKEAADINAVRAILSTNLESIDTKLDTELAEIRESKIVFDTRIGELINAINAEANQDVTALKADTTAMRVELEAIAEEARNNAWKSALLKIASTGITVAGIAAGTAVGAPQAGLVVGQAVGGLVEQGGNELFHYESTDRIARRVARSSVLNRSRRAPALPDANQIRNAKDVSREIVRGLREGIDIGNRRTGDFGGASQGTGFPEEMSATIVLQWPDGGTIELRDQMIRLQDQSRSL